MLTCQRLEEIGEDRTFFNRVLILVLIALTSTAVPLF